MYLKVVIESFVPGCKSKLCPILTFRPRRKHTIRSYTACASVCNRQLVKCSTLGVSPFGTNMQEAVSLLGIITVYVFFLFFNFSLCFCVFYLLSVFLLSEVFSWHIRGQSLVEVTETAPMCSCFFSHCGQLRAALDAFLPSRKVRRFSYGRVE